MAASACCAQQDSSGLRLERAGFFLFRRTFADAQFMKSEKEIDVYYQRQQKSAPQELPVINENKEVRKKLVQYGFIKGTELKLNKFQSDIPKKIMLTDSLGRKLEVNISLNAEQKGVLSVSDSTGSCSSMADDADLGLKYATADIIPGGYKEIILLCEWYISNGYNFDVVVFEIKHN